MRTRAGIISILVLSMGCDNEAPYPEILEVRALSALAFADPDKSCAECHPQHVKEWRISNHAYASRDPVFIAMVKTAQRQSEGKVGQFCTQCHMPIAVAYEMTPVYFDEVSRVYTQDVVNVPPEVRKGVTCDVCHAITNVRETSNARITLSPDGIRRGTIEDPVPTHAHQSAYSELHASSRVCSACHAVVNGKGALIEQTFPEWTISKAASEGKQCQDCHMPVYRGKAATKGPERDVHRHLFVGVDVSLLPEDEFPGYWEMRELTANLLRESVHFSVQFNAEEKLLQLTIENRAGHSLPSGATADRQMWVEVIVRDETGKIVLESGTLDARGDIRDGILAHSLQPGTDPNLVYFGQLLLGSAELDAAADAATATRIRARLSAACLPMGLGGITPQTGATIVDFPWSASWQCDYMIPPDTTVFPTYQIDRLKPGEYTADVRLLFRTFPPFLLRKLEVIGGLDPMVKSRLPTVTMGTESIRFPIE
jgi:hypothetical protein